MPYSYTPEGTIDRQNALAALLMQRAQQGQSGKYGPLAGLLSGLTAGAFMNAGQRAAEGNQQYNENFLSGLPEGADAKTLSSFLLKSRNPKHQELGISLIGKQPSALDIEYKQSQIDKNRAQAGSVGAKPSPTQLRYKYETEDAITSIEGSRQTIQRAKELLKQGIYEGGLAGVQTELGSKWDYGGLVSKSGLVDKDKATRTAEYLNIMKPDAMSRMAEELKGSTAYQEMLAYAAIYADPTVPNSVKEAMLDRILAGYDRQIEKNRGRATELGATDMNAAAPVSKGPLPLAPKDQLEPRQVYELPDGRQGLWNGSGFEVLN